MIPAKAIRHTNGPDSKFSGTRILQNSKGEISCDFWTLWNHILRFRNSSVILVGHDRIVSQSHCFIVAYCVSLSVLSLCKCKPVIHLTDTM